MCLLVIWSMVLAAVRAFAAGRRRFDLTNAERWLSVISRLPLLVLVAILGGLTVESAALITYGTGAASMLVLLLVLRERSEPVGSTPLWGRRLLSFGSQAWIGTIGSYLVLRVDQALIAPLVGVAQLGYYAVAVSLAEVPSTLQLAMRDVMFVTATDRNDPHLIARGSRVLLIVTTVLAVIGAVASPVALPLLFGADFRPAVRMAQILLVAGIPAGVTMVVGAGLMSSGRPRSRAIAQLVGLAVNVALLFVLVPPLGAIGASWTALISYTLIAAIVVVLFARHTPVKAHECVVPRRGDVVLVRQLVERILGRLGRVLPYRRG
jgi:O-antigen/teichoic acid export membrane protein